MSLDQFQNVNNLGLVWSSVEDVLGRLGWFWLTEKLFVLVQFDVWKCLEHILSVEYLKAIQIHIVISFFLLLVTIVTHRLSFWTQIHKCWIKKYDKTNANTYRKMEIQIWIIIIISKFSKSWISLKLNRKHLGTPGIILINREVACNGPIWCLEVSETIYC